MKLLCRYIDDRIRHRKCVHIAGGSGKTSCALMLASIFDSAGLKTGIFTRPAYSEERETISVGGQVVSCADFAVYTDRVAKAAKAMTADIIAAKKDALAPSASKITKNLLEGKISPEPSYNELLCAIALLCFHENNCDVMILECGDSRADPTGVIEPPTVSVICGSGLTSEQLRTGIGIIRRGTREVVCSVAPGEAYSAVLNACVKAGSRLTVPARAELDLIHRNLGGRDFEYRGKEYHLPLCPEYQALNSLTAIETAYALRRSGMAIDGDAVVRGLAKARVPLRFEIISLSPFIVVDCPMRESDATAIMEALKDLSEYFGKDVYLVTDYRCYHVSDDLLFNYGMTLKGHLNPLTAEEMRETICTAANLKSNESMLILGSMGLAEKVAYNIRKHLGIG